MGLLVFETADGKPDLVPADRLGTLLREHRIPVVVLNACQSAMVDNRAADPFASVAAALLKAGVRSVVAMGYSLYVSGAQHFLPAFYRRLFESGSVTEAVRAGRQQMFRNQGRVCARGSYDLQDWLVPVSYAHDTVDFCFATAVPQQASVFNESTFPEEAQDSKNPYGFVGRDGALLSLERAMMRPPAGILIHGLGGSGKTTLARGFIHWLRQTEGLGEGCFWFTFSDIQSAEFVFNQMGEAIFGDTFLAEPLPLKVDVLAQALFKRPFLIVWDNFESVRGIEGTSVIGLISQADQQHLKRFLEKLRGGKTKVLITSRSEEDWFGSANRYKLPLRGLQGEERWEFCRIILRDLGRTIDRNDPDLFTLMDSLDGHPLMMRVVLPQLEDKSAATLLAAMVENLEALGLKGEETWERLQATMRFVIQGLPVELQPLLIPLALHKRFIIAGFLEYIATQVDSSWTGQKIDHFFEMLSLAGLVQEVYPSLYEIHPALTGFLQEYTHSANDNRDAWVRAFVNLMAYLADDFAQQPLHEKWGRFHVHGSSFYVALAEATAHGMDKETATLIQAIATYWKDSRNYEAAGELFLRLAGHCNKCGYKDMEASAYNQLGGIAEKQRKFPAAFNWFNKSLEISEMFLIERCTANSYLHLGTIALDQKDLPVAETLYKKSLEIEEKLGNKPGAAQVYHQLAMIFQLQQDLLPQRIGTKRV